LVSLNRPIFFEGCSTYSASSAALFKWERKIFF
jgi:hypothetical protein